MIDQRVALPARGKLTDWKSGLRKVLWSSTKRKCKVLHLGRNKPRHLYTPGTNWLESNCEGNNLGVLLINKLPMSQQCTFRAKKANSMLGCIRKSLSSRLRDSPVLSTGEAITRVLWPARVSAVQDRGELTVLSPVKGHKDLKRLEHLSYEERLQELPLFKRRFKSILSMCINSWWKTRKKRESGSFQ